MDQSSEQAIVKRAVAFLSYGQLGFLLECLGLDSGLFDLKLPVVRMLAANILAEPGLDPLASAPGPTQQAVSP